jgi:hypothetical protein
MADNIIKYIDVSNPLFISLIIGYLGYWCCYHGFKYGKEERLFKIAVYSLPSLILFNFYEYSIKYIVISFVTTVLIAIFWRAKGKRWFYNILYKFRISNEDNSETVLNSIMNNNTIDITQIFVGLKNGKVLNCSNILDYKKSGIRYFIIDRNGNIAIYVDSITDTKGNIETYNELKNSDYGDLLTIINKEEISYISLRNKKRRCLLCSIIEYFKARLSCNLI